MIVGFRLLYVILLIIATSSNTLFAERTFDEIDMSAGLSHNSALCLLEDHDGFLWVGTRDGLNKFDGAEFEIFKHEFFDSTSLINNHVNCLYETRENELWIGTANGLCIYSSQTNTFRVFSLLTDSHQYDSYYIRTIFETKDGRVWVGTTNGLYVVNKQRDKVTYKLIESDDNHLANNVLKIYQDSNGTLWLGTSNGLYWRQDEKFEQYFIDKTKKLERQAIREIIEDEDGYLWLGTERHGIYVLETESDFPEVKYQLNIENSLLSSNTVRSIFHENSDNVWIGTFAGLCIFNKQYKSTTVFDHFQRNKGAVSNNSIRDILTDSQGGIWLAVYQGGLNYYHPQKNLLHHYLWQTQKNPEIENRVISALIENEKQQLWLGSEGGGVYLSEDGGISITKIINPGKNTNLEKTVKALSQYKENLWIGSLAGLTHYNFKTQKKINYYHNPNDNNSINPGHVLALFQENEEKVWIGTNGGGVQLFNPLTGRFKDVEPFENKHVRCFLKDSKGDIWIGCERELFVLDSKSNKLKNLNQEIENWLNEEVDVIFIHEDTNKNIWFGARGRGLYLIKNNELHWFNTGNGLNDNTVNSMLDGGENVYWITTNKGLSKIEIDDRENEKISIESRSYAVSEGAQGMQYSSNCALQSYSGKLYFGGINGLNAFNPREIKEIEFYPNLVFKELQIDNKLIKTEEENSPLQKVLNETDNLILRYNQRDFSISFAGINFINPDKNNYRYRVVGLDDDWVEMGNQNTINFTYFPVGTYEIRLQVATNPQKWGADYRQLSLTVLPPWWKTWWAFLLYSFVLVVLLSLFFILSQRWAKMKNQLEMEHFQREKESELHHLKLKFYTDVSHELRTPLTLILAPLENLISKSELPIRFRNQLSQIQRSGLRLMQLVNQILDLRKLETGHENLQVAKGNIIRFFSEISLAFKEVATSKNIDFEFEPLREECLIWYDRDKLEIIVNNLLSNAIKFTPDGGKVKLKLKKISGRKIGLEAVGIDKSADYLQIRVIDNGEGLTESQIENIFNRFYSKKETGNNNSPGSGVGLELTRRMVELHKGVINVSSIEHESGKKETTFSVYLSLDKKIYSNEELDEDFKNSEDASLYTFDFLQRETVVELSEVDQESTEAGDEFERLLIVEDNAEVRAFVKELFADNYEISEAANGETGLQKAIETNPQIIISDVMMPVMDGIELCKRIKTDARTSHIPVILLTARTALTFKYEGLETGADDYITKPFSARYLALRVKNLIEQRRKIQEHFKRKTICDPGSITLTSVDERILKKAVDYITANISNPTLSVTKISEHVGLSRVHFYRKIKALTNQTAVEFIRNVRLKRAATLLLENKISVKEVRNLVGFDDADYFRKCFKDQFGVTPSEYSKEH
ncbi:two-component regulator propeller domain-containing protein [uncultured Draconibacterium sp.]|uniref:hybrid sensor histidine kinase/response regulator transcription factor n=1 Tax=uncultured Draconibacterium sp. TaxID=1573823 RepID=UPI002AA805E8|nr:two-component regulator propeller domain-containing protein [uncultured Draconibacterium sp.]